MDEGPLLVEEADPCRIRTGLVEGVVAEDLDAPRRRAHEAGGHSQQCRLARPVRAHQGDDPPGRKRQGAVLESPGEPVALGEPFCDHDVRHGTALLAAVLSWVEARLR